jgi:hypothetical protein
MGRSPLVAHNGVEGTDTASVDGGCAMGEGGTGVMEDQLNVPLEDAELLAEVELTTNLIIAASESDASLPQDEIDRLLGLDVEAINAPIPVQKARNSA